MAVKRVPSSARLNAPLAMRSPPSTVGAASVPVRCRLAFNVPVTCSISGVNASATLRSMALDSTWRSTGAVLRRASSRSTGAGGSVPRTVSHSAPRSSRASIRAAVASWPTVASSDW